jgi:hypothetical protein
MTLLTGTICLKHLTRNIALFELHRQSKAIRLEVGACMIPKNAQGEDAYFISSDCRALGLADGMLNSSSLFLHHLPTVVVFDAFCLLPFIVRCVRGVCCLCRQLSHSKQVSADGFNSISILENFRSC